MFITCDVNGCGREAKAGGKCLGHALEERKKNEAQEPEKPAPKKRGRKPKTKTDGGVLPEEAIKPKLNNPAILTFNLTESLKQKLIEFAILKLLEERE